MVFHFHDDVDFHLLTKIFPFFPFTLFDFCTFLHACLCNTSCAEITTNFDGKLNFNFNFASRHIWATAWSKPPLYIRSFPQLLTLQCITLTIQNAYVIWHVDHVIHSNRIGIWGDGRNERRNVTWSRKILECCKTPHTCRWQNKLMQKRPINSVRTKLRNCHTTILMT